MSSDERAARLRRSVKPTSEAVLPSAGHTRHPSHRRLFSLVALAGIHALTGPDASRVPAGLNFGETQTRDSRQGVRLRTTLPSRPTRRGEPGSQEPRKAPVFRLRNQFSAFPGFLLKLGPLTAACPTPSRHVDEAGDAQRTSPRIQTSRATLQVFAVTRFQSSRRAR